MPSTFQVKRFTERNICYFFLKHRYRAGGRHEQMLNLVPPISIIDTRVPSPSLPRFINLSLESYILFLSFTASLMRSFISHYSHRHLSCLCLNFSLFHFHPLSLTIRLHSFVSTRPDLRTTFLLGCAHRSISLPNLPSIERHVISDRPSWF